MQMNTAPEQLWEYYCQIRDTGLFGKGDLFGEASERIAWSDELGAEIFLTSELGTPYLALYADDELVDKLEFDETNAEEVYVGAISFFEDEDIPFEDDLDENDEAKRRKESLLDAAYDFLHVLCEDAESNVDIDLSDKIEKEITTPFLALAKEYMERGWGVPIYDPEEEPETAEK